MARRSSVLLLTALLLLSSCSSSPEEKEPEAVDSSSPTPTASIPSEEITSPSSEETTSPGELLDAVHGSGDALVKDGTASMSIDVEFEASTGLAEAQGLGAFDYRQNSGYLDTAITLPGVSKPLDLTTITDFPLTYMNLGEALDKLPFETPDLKPWLVLDRTVLDDQIAYEKALGLMHFTQFDIGMYSLFPEGVVEATEAGSEPVNGSPATHYETTFDMGLLTSKVTPKIRSILWSMSSTIKVWRWPMDVWIDAEGRLVKAQFEMTLNDPSGGVERRMTVDLSFSDFGEKVEIDRPPSKDVMEVQELSDFSVAN
jgi:hypothetical protein